MIRTQPISLLKLFLLYKSIVWLKNLKIQKGNTFQTKWKTIPTTEYVYNLFILSVLKKLSNLHHKLYLVVFQYIISISEEAVTNYFYILSETWKSTTQMTIVCMIWASLFLLLLREQLKILLPFNFSIIFFHQARKYHVANINFLCSCPWLTVLDSFIEFKWVRMCSKLNEIPFEGLFLCNICKL